VLETKVVFYSHTVMGELWFSVDNMYKCGELVVSVLQTTVVNLKSQFDCRIVILSG